MDIIRKPGFVSTTGQTYKLVVIRVEEFEDNDRTTSNIRTEAERRGYLTPPAEVAPLLRELISDEEIKRMGLLGLIVMHEPIVGPYGYYPIVFGLDRHDIGRWLHGADISSDGPRWDCERGFVFLAPQE